MRTFVMTYPCYIVLSPSGWPDCMKTDMGMAVCIFTDERLAEQYCKAKSRAIRERTGEEVRDFELIGFKHAEALLAAFHKATAALAEKGIQRVAIDPSNSADTPKIGLARFLTDVEHSI